MKQFKISSAEGRVLWLHYPTLEEAQKHYPDAEIEEVSVQPYVEYIRQILDSAVNCRTVERNGSIAYLLRLNTPVGTCLVQLFQNKIDGIWHKCIKYQLWKVGQSTIPCEWTITDPADFCAQFMFPKMEYSVLCIGKTYSKPKELRGIQKFSTISSGFKNDRCQLFLKGDNLYINTHDYFSPSWRPPTGEIGKPIKYYVKKYFGASWTEYRPFADCYTDIILQNRAWVRLTNFTPLVRILDGHQTAQAVWSLIRMYHGWDEKEYSMDWVRVLEVVANTTRKHICENVPYNPHPHLQKEVGVYTA